jgi:hypothetical protein
VEGLRGTSDRVRELMGLVEEVDEEIPPFEAILRRAGELGDESRPPASSPARPRWGRRMAWAASIMVALGAGWLANEWNSASPDIRLDPLQVRQAPASLEVGEEEVAATANAGEPQAEDPEGLEVPFVASEAAGTEESELAVETPPTAGDAARSLAAASRTPSEGEPRLEPLPAEPDPVARLSLSRAPRRATIRGRVVDEVTGLPLEAAQVGIPGTGAGTLTDADGRFLLLAEPAPDSGADLLLAVDILGYRREELALDRTGDDVEVGEVELTPTAVALDELVVGGGAGANDVAAVTFVRAVPKEVADDRWGPVSMEEARDHLGQAVETLPGLPVTGVHIGVFDGVPMVRVEQELDDGSPLILIQSRVPVQIPPDDTGSAVTIVTADEVFVAGWGDLPADSLRRLLRGIASN